MFHQSERWLVYCPWCDRAERRPDGSLIFVADKHLRQVECRRDDCCRWRQEMDDMCSPMPEIEDDGKVPEFAVPWIGKRCRVILDDQPPEEAFEDGVLRHVDMLGEGVIVTDDGRRTWVWPVLRIEELVE